MLDPPRSVLLYREIDVAFPVDELSDGRQWQEAIDDLVYGIIDYTTIHFCLPCRFQLMLWKKNVANMCIKGKFGFQTQPMKRASSFTIRPMGSNIPGYVATFTLVPSAEPERLTISASET